MIDDKALGQALPFSTCVSSGCLVPIIFPTAVTEAITTAETLKVIAMPSGGTEPMVFPFVLEGFAAALKRLAALVN